MHANRAGMPPYWQTTKRARKRDTSPHNQAHSKNGTKVIVFTKGASESMSIQSVSLSQLESHLLESTNSQTLYGSESDARAR